MRAAAFCLMVWAVAWPAQAHAEAVHLIICGSGGDAQFTKTFADWGRRLNAALGGDGANRTHLLLEQPDTEQGERASTREAIEALFAEVGEGMRGDQAVFVYLIGHGSHRAGVSKLNIPGPDITAEELGALIDGLPAGRWALVNGSSASAGFINVLSGQDRAICTATRSAEDRNATQFMGHFVEALETGSADQDRDGRVLLLEACAQAAIATAAAYEREGLIATEHALLDDNGDGLGTRLPIEAAETTEGAQPVDGLLAATLLIRERRYPDHVPQDLIIAYEGALEAVDALKAQKAQLDEAAYYEQLDALLLDAARAHRALREAAANPPEAAPRVDPPSAPEYGVQGSTDWRRSR